MSPRSERGERRARRADRGLAVVVALLFGCAKQQPPAPDAGNADRSDAGRLAVELPAATVEAGASAAPRERDVCADRSMPRSGKSIGHTSTVFKLELANGKKVAWKPNARNVKGRYRGEIAAYRLALALGIDNVIPACPRVFDHDAILAALRPEAGAVLVDQGLVEDGKHYGATIDWVEGLSFWPVEKEPLRGDVRRWLTAGAEIPPDKADLARQASTMIVFDFMTGNWDRYSGENVGWDKAGAKVLYIDNDAAFMESPPKDALARNRALLDATDRFSKTVVTRVRALDEQKLKDVFGDEETGRPLLTSKAVALVHRRIEELRRVIDAKIADRGEAAALPFP